MAALKVGSGLALLFLAFLTSGCQGTQAGQPPTLEEGVADMTIQLSSSVFNEGGTIPKKYTCDGENLPPPLSWSGVPQGTKSLALVVIDPDAPRGDWVHWVLVDLPPDLESLPEETQGAGVEGVNDFGKRGYGGPCPPRGSNHRYFFRLYALDQVLNLKTGMTRSEAEKAMQGRILAQGQLMGRFSR